MQQLFTSSTQILFDTPVDMSHTAEQPRTSFRGTKRQRDAGSGSVCSEPLDKVVRDHADLVRRMARRYVRATGAAVDMDDLLSVGVMGLLEAHQLYDPSGGRPFRVYAEFRVRGAILDELRRLDPMSQSMRRKVKAFVRAKKDLANCLGREPNEEELAEHLEVSLDEVHKLRRGVEHRFVPYDKTNPSELISNAARSKKDSTQLRLTLSKAIEKLPERDQQLLALYYLQDLTMKEIGRILELTEARISQLHKQAVKKLRAILEKDGALV